MQVESGLLFETPAEICERVFRQLRPRTPVPEFTVSFAKFANASSQIRMSGGAVELKVTDLLREAPSPILEALAYILIAKLYRRPIPRDYNDRYRMYLNRDDVREQITEIRQQRGRKMTLPALGSFFDLGEVFNAVNARFFNGEMAVPALGWSRQASRTILGHCDSAHNTIVLSKLLDQRHVPRVVVEYVMYHEMLHLRHPVESRGATRSIHTPAFRAAEKLFPEIREAKAEIKKICSRSWRPSLF